MISNLFARLLMATAMTSLGTITTSAYAAQPIKLTYTNWADTEAVVYVAKYVLETKLQQPVDLMNADMGLQWSGVARGDIDLMCGAWLPVTHGQYYAKYKNDIVDIGVIYTGAKIGWAVPDYVPESEASSISDLNKPDVKSKMNGTIQGIEPGAGEMIASEKALKAYDLAGYNLQASSEAGMLASVSRAYQSKSWIVATVWSPHWLFQKWKMRYLKDPKGTLGGEEQIHAIASRSFAGKFPRADVFLHHYKLTLADVETIELDGNASNDWAGAAKRFVDAHPEKVKAWLEQ